MDKDEKYKNGLALALYEALIQFSKGDANVAVIESGPAFDALIKIAAFVAAPNPHLNSPKAVRTFGEKAGKDIGKQIAAIKANPEADAIFAEIWTPANPN